MPSHNERAVTDLIASRFKRATYGIKSGEYAAINSGGEMSYISGPTDVVVYAGEGFDIYQTQKIKADQYVTIYNMCTNRGSVDDVGVRIVPQPPACPGDDGVNQALTSGVIVGPAEFMVFRGERIVVSALPTEDAFLAGYAFESRVVSPFGSFRTDDVHRAFTPDEVDLRNTREGRMVKLPDLTTKRVLVRARVRHQSVAENGDDGIIRAVNEVYTVQGVKAWQHQPCYEEVVRTITEISFPHSNKVLYYFAEDGSARILTRAKDVVTISSPGLSEPRDFIWISPLSSVHNFRFKTRSAEVECTYKANFRRDVPEDKEVCSHPAQDLALALAALEQKVARSLSVGSEEDLSTLALAIPKEVFNENLAHVLLHTVRLSE